MWLVLSKGGLSTRPMLLYLKISVSIRPVNLNNITARSGCACGEYQKWGLFGYF